MSVDRCIRCFGRDARDFELKLPLCGMCARDIKSVTGFLAFHAPNVLREAADERQGEIDVEADERPTARVGGSKRPELKETT